MLDTKKDLSKEIGKRVRVTECSPAEVVGGYGVITRIYSDSDRLQQVYVKLDSHFEQGPHTNGEWVINGWEDVPSTEHVTRENIVGMTLIARYVPGYTEHEGKEFVVEKVHHASQEAWTNGLCVFGQFDGVGLYVHRWDAPEKQPVDLTESLVITAKNQRIEVLEEELRKAQERLEESQRYYSHDLGAINRLANEEADQQDWCSTYEDTLEAMNSVLIGGYVLEGRSFDFEVEAYEEVTVRVKRSWSGQARNADAAKEAAGEYFDENSLSDDDVISALREYADPSYSDRDASYRWSVEKV